MNGDIDRLAKRQSREFDLLTPPKHNRIDLSFANPSNLDKAFKFAEGKVPGGITRPEVVASVIAHNPKSVFLFWRDDEVVGIYATLLLSPLGLEGLLLGELNTSVPPLDCLAEAGSSPAAIYNWVVIAPGLASEGIQHVSQSLRKPDCMRANLFSRPTSPTGVAINKKLGFVPIFCGTQELYRYTRLSNRTGQFKNAA